MKIKPDSDEYLAITAGFQKVIDLNTTVEEANALIATACGSVTNRERIRWNILHGSVGYSVASRGGTFTDDHIDTAMKSVCRGLGLDLV